ncbi:MAG: CPBP family intramembrane metalloprotease [Chloroflexi bacterium]|nr:CPBP family intramembrane metalloprotease [Chloroflexota bacterium]
MITESAAHSRTCMPWSVPPGEPAGRARAYAGVRGTLARMFADWPPADTLPRRVWRASDLALGVSVLLVVFLLALAVAVGRVFLVDAPEDTATVPGALITLAFELVLGGIVVYLALRRRVPWRALGFRPPEGALVVGAVVAAYAAILVYQGLLAAAEVLGVDASGLRRGNPLPADRETALFTWAVLGIAVVAVAPVAEELFFRALIFRATAGWVSVPAAYAISGVSFGLFHLNPSVIVPFSAIGAIFAWAYWRSKSLWTAIAAHAIVNATSLFFTVVEAFR